MDSLNVPLLPSWVRWSAVVLLAGIIFYLSIVTTPPEQPVVPKFDLVPLDKWRHFLAYAALGGSLAYATADWDARTGYVAGFVLGVTVLYGIGIEIGQSALPRRYFSIGDAYANALGAVLISPWYLVRRRVTFVRVPTATDPE